MGGGVGEGKDRDEASETYYMVSGGPMMVICHSKTLESSTRPAEKPSMGFRLSSARGEKREWRLSNGLVGSRVGEEESSGCLPCVFLFFSRMRREKGEVTRARQHFFTEYEADVVRTKAWIPTAVDTCACYTHLSAACEEATPPGPTFSPLFLC